MASNATSHGAFDDDPVTVKSTLLRILNVADSTAQFGFARSSASQRSRRKLLDSLPH
jgi:hypothetical protein